MAVPSEQLPGNLLTSDDLTDSDYYRLLESRRRRVLLDVLSERDGPLSVGEVAKRVADAESDGASVSEETRDEVRIDIHHVHLPLLSDYGVVDYDWTTRRVEL